MSPKDEAKRILGLPRALQYRALNASMGKSLRYNAELITEVRELARAQDVPEPWQVSDNPRAAAV